MVVCTDGPTTSTTTITSESHSTDNSSATHDAGINKKAELSQR